MGYTHYWYINPAKGKAKEIEAAYQRAIRDCQRIAHYYQKNAEDWARLSGYTAHCSVGSYGGLMVNGKGEEAHEPFIMREHFSQNDGGFCKTARKPYDMVVVACLAVLKHRLKGAFEVSSDGYAEDHEAGIALAQHVTGLKIKASVISGKKRLANRLRA